MSQAYQSLIDGKWVGAANGINFPNFNPADTRDEIGQFADLNATDMETAVEAAAKAYPAWRALGAQARATLLEKAAKILESRLDEVASALTREEGKSLMEARGETTRGVVILRYFAGEGLRPLGEVLPSANPKTLLF